MKRPQALIFDMDGLMIDSERVTRDQYYKVAKEDGFDFNDAFYRSLLGKNKKAIFERFYEVYGKDFPIGEVFERVHKYIRDEYDQNGVPVKKGLVNLLEWAKSEGIPCVVATSSARSRVDDILKRTGLEPYFVDSICGDEIEKGKPNPEIFLKAAKKAGKTPEECLVLEDSLSGIQAANAADIPVFLILDLFEPDASQKENCALVLDSLDEAKDVLEKL